MKKLEDEVEVECNCTFCDEPAIMEINQMYGYGVRLCSEHVKKLLVVDKLGEKVYGRERNS